MIFSIKPEARVLIIDSREELDKFCADYPQQWSEETKEWVKSVSYDGYEIRGIDWKAAQQDYDIFIFTENGVEAFDHGNFIGNRALDVPSVIVAHPEVLADIEPYFADYVLTRTEYGQDDITSDIITDIAPSNAEDNDICI